MHDIVETFKRQVDDVSRLIAFDQDVIAVVIRAVEELRNRLVARDITNEQQNGERLLTILGNIKENQSLKSRYALILNQAIVLLVSYFGSAVEDIFVRSITRTMRAASSERLRGEELRLTVGELLGLADNPEEALPALLIERKDLSFQDMQAIHRAFKDYIGVDVPRDVTVNNIILAQACRHVIVHAGGEVTARLIRQVKGAKPREIKPDLVEGNQVHFSEGEVKLVAGSMVKYVSSLATLAGGTSGG